MLAVPFIHITARIIGYLSQPCITWISIELHNTAWNYALPMMDDEGGRIGKGGIVYPVGQ